MFESYRDSLFNNKIIMPSQLRFKSNHHDVYTEEINRIEMMVKLKKDTPIKLYYNKI